MEAIIVKIQQEVDESNKAEELIKQQKAEHVVDVGNEDLITLDLSKLENAVNCFSCIKNLNKTVDKTQKDVKSRIYVIDKVHKEAGERDTKIKELEK